MLYDQVVTGHGTVHIALYIRYSEGNLANKTLKLNKKFSGAVQKNCKHATLKEKTVIAQNHLRYASKRLEGRKKKEG